MPIIARQGENGCEVVIVCDRCGEEIETLAEGRFVVDSSTAIPTDDWPRRGSDVHFTHAEDCTAEHIEDIREEGFDPADAPLAGFVALLVGGLGFDLMDKED